MRNTYDHRLANHSRNASQQNHAQTYTQAKQKPFSYQKPANSNANSNERLTKFIIETLKKVSMNGTRYSVLTTLKPNQKTLLSTISSLLRSFDKSFEQSFLSVDMLIQLFKMVGYPGNINKTFFQPVGAPHTWSQCLAMMEWLSELASFHYDLRAHIEQRGGGDEGLNNLLIRGHFEKNPELAKQYLLKSIQKNQRLIEDYNYSTKTTQLAMANLKRSQKDLSELAQQDRKLEGRLFRQSQQAIQLQQSNRQLEKALQSLKYEISEGQRQAESHQKNISNLKAEISTQQLSVEEVDKIKLNIIAYQEKIVQLKKSHFIEMQHFDKSAKNSIQQYVQFDQSVGMALKEMLRRNGNDIEKRNVFIQAFDCSLQQFTDYLGNQDEGSQMKAEQLLQSKQVREIVHKISILLKVFESEIRQQQSTKEGLTNDIDEINEEILQRERTEREKLKQLSEKTTKLQELQERHRQARRTYQDLQANLQKVLKDISDQSRQYENQMQTSQQLLAQIKQFSKMKKEIQAKKDEVLQTMKQGQEVFQEGVLELLEGQYIHFQNMNVNLSQNPAFAKINSMQNAETEEKLKMGN